MLCCLTSSSSGISACVPQELHAPLNRKNKTNKHEFAWTFAKNLVGVTSQKMKQNDFVVPHQDCCPKTKKTLIKKYQNKMSQKAHDPFFVSFFHNTCGGTKNLSTSMVQRRKIQNCTKDVKLK